MRIIAGKYRGRKLKSPPSTRTRPTSDRLRETLFNILALQVGGARLLDLCAGTGAVGIEAISRGASYVTFVDQSRKMCALIEANCEALEIADDTSAVVTADALDFLKRAAKTGSLPFDVLYFDPPYVADYEPVLQFIGQHPQLRSPDATVVVEHYKKRELNERFGNLKRYRVVKQGDSVLSFYDAD